MKVYLINLDRSPERLEWFMGQVEGKGIDVVRVPAVDARQLPNDEFERLLTLTSGHNSMSPAEMGCLLSHRKVWQLVVDGVDEWAFVAEDDIHLSAAGPLFLRDDRWIPQGAEIVRAETDTQKRELSYKVWSKPFEHDLRRLKSKNFGSGGYFISRGAAARLVEHTARKIEPADVILFSPMDGMLHEIVSLQIVPAICVQDVWVTPELSANALVSEIAQNRHAFHRTDTRSARRRGVAKLRHEVVRVGRQVAGLMYKARVIGLRTSIFLKVPVGTGLSAGGQR